MSVTVSDSDSGVSTGADHITFNFGVPGVPTGVIIVLLDPDTDNGNQGGFNTPTGWTALPYTVEYPGNVQLFVVDVFAFTNPAVYTPTFTFQVAAVDTAVDFGWSYMVLSGADPLNFQGRLTLTGSHFDGFSWVPPIDECLDPTLTYFEPFLGKYILKYHYIGFVYCCNGDGGPDLSATPRAPMTDALTVPRIGSDHIPDFSQPDNWRRISGMAVDLNNPAGPSGSETGTRKWDVLNQTSVVWSELFIQTYYPIGAGLVLTESAIPHWRVGQVTAP